MAIHNLSAAKLIEMFGPDEAIEQVEISCAESGDTTTSDPKVEELLFVLYASSDALHQDRIDNL